MRQKARLLIVVLFCTIYSFVNAQITINGTVTDNDLNPISNALVEIIDESDTSNRYSDLTDEFGSYTISNITDIPSISTTPPTDHIILRNYPNPFNPSTVIYVELSKAEKIEIKIYDILGRVVRLLHNNYHKAGTYQIIWDGRNNFGAGVSAGIYFCRLKTEDQFKVHKMVLLDGGPKAASISSTTAKKADIQKRSKINNMFNFTIKVSGNSILESEFTYLNCSGDTTVNLMVPIILQTATIGLEGGKLETEDFSLIIPEGAFIESVTLNLGIETDSISFEDETFSRLFRVDGLPEFYFKDLPLKIKLETQSIDSISFAVGSTDSPFFTEEEFIDFAYYPAKDSSGYAITSLISPFTNSIGLLKYQNSLNNTSNFKKLIVALAKQGKVKSSNGNFDFTYPKRYANIIPVLDEFLEGAVEVIELLGFNKAPLRTNIFTSNWPVEVQFQNNYNPIDEDVVRNKAYASIYKQGAYKIYENRYALTKTWKIKIINFYNFAASLLNLRRTLGRDVFFNFIFQEQEYFWLNGSLPFWSEKLFPNDENHIPTFFDLALSDDKNPVAVICNGLAAPDKLISPKEIAFSALIEFLTKTNGDNIIVDIHNSIISRKTSVGGLIHALSDTENIWWPNFFKEFIQGNIYNVPSEEFLKNVTETIEFNDGDTYKYPDDETYNDLSAKLFRININSEEIKDNKSLNFKIGPESLNLTYVKTIIFGLSSGKLKYISEGTDISIGNLNDYEALIACVVNSGNEPPYTDSSNIELDINVENVFPYKFCNISTNVQAVFEFERIPTLPDDNLPDTTTSTWSQSWRTRGSFTGNVFNGIIETIGESRPLIGDIRLTLDENLDITSFTLSGIHDQNDIFIESRISGVNISPTSINSNSVEYKIYNTNACNYLMDVYHYYESPWTSTAGVRSYSKMINYFCQEDSYLVIELLIN